MGRTKYGLTATKGKNKFFNGQRVIASAKVSLPQYKALGSFCPINSILRRLSIFASQNPGIRAILKEAMHGSVSQIGNITTTNQLKTVRLKGLNAKFFEIDSVARLIDEYKRFLDVGYASNQFKTHTIDAGLLDMLFDTIGQNLLKIVDGRQDDNFKMQLSDFVNLSHKHLLNSSSKSYLSYVRKVLFNDNSDAAYVYHKDVKPYSIYANSRVYSYNPTEFDFPFSSLDEYITHIKSWTMMLGIGSDFPDLPGGAYSDMVMALIGLSELELLDDANAPGSAVAKHLTGNLFEGTTPGSGTMDNARNILERLALNTTWGDNRGFASAASSFIRSMQLKLVQALLPHFYFVRYALRFLEIGTALPPYDLPIKTFSPKKESIAKNLEFLASFKLPPLLEEMLAAQMSNNVQIGPESFETQNTLHMPAWYARYFHAPITHEMLYGQEGLVRYLNEFAVKLSNSTVIDVIGWNDVIALYPTNGFKLDLAPFQFKCSSDGEGSMKPQVRAGIFTTEKFNVQDLDYVLPINVEAICSYKKTVAFTDERTGTDPLRIRKLLAATKMPVSYTSYTMDEAINYLDDGFDGGKNLACHNLYLVGRAGTRLNETEQIKDLVFFGVLPKNWLLPWYVSLPADQAIAVPSFEHLVNELNLSGLSPDYLVATNPGLRVLYDTDTQNVRDHILFKVPDRIFSNCNFYFEPKNGVPMNLDIYMSDGRGVARRSGGFWQIVCTSTLTCADLYQVGDSLHLPIIETSGVGPFLKPYVHD